MFQGVAVDGSSSCIPGEAEPEEEESAFEQEDDDIGQSPMSTNSHKRASSTSTTATSPERKTKSPMVKIMQSIMERWTASNEATQRILHGEKWRNL